MLEGYVVWLYGLFKEFIMETGMNKILIKVREILNEALLWNFLWEIFQFEK